MVKQYDFVKGDKMDYFLVFTADTVTSGRGHCSFFSKPQNSFTTEDTEDTRGV